MSGMYPDNQSISIFGEQVQWPGVDENGKYTNGSFDDPAQKPSFIPAESINLILDNLASIITKCGGNPNATDISQIADLMTHQTIAKGLMMRDENGRAKVAAPEALDDIVRLFELNTAKDDTIAAMKEFIWPVGIKLIQLPGDPSPVERGLPGNWENWSLRADMYGVCNTVPPSTLAADIALYGVDVWNLNTDGSVATQGTKKYTRPVGFLYNERKKCGNAISEDDWEVGHQIVGGIYDGYYVWEPVCLGGKFLSVSDGGTFRPPFESGVVGDKIREIAGNIYDNYGGPNMAGSGAFYYGIMTTSVAGGSAGRYGHMIFNASRVVPVGSQNSPATFSVIIWRRVT